VVGPICKNRSFHTYHNEPTIEGMNNDDRITPAPPRRLPEAPRTEARTGDRTNQAPNRWLPEATATEARIGDRTNQAPNRWLPEATDRPAPSGKEHHETGRENQPMTDTRSDPRTDRDRRCNRARLALLAWLPVFPLLAAGACAGPQTTPRATWHNVAFAAGPAASDMPAGGHASPAPAPGGEPPPAGTNTREPSPAGTNTREPSPAGAVRGGAPLPAIAVRRISEETLRDPAQRTSVMQRIARQIAVKTRGVPADRYTEELRPRLQHQLREAGFAPDDVDFILADVDTSRAPR
jgi:hypothetical protein